MSSAQQVQWQEVQKILNSSGQPVQQVPFAQYVVNIGAVQGGVINLAGPGKEAVDRIHPRPNPPHILPRGVSGFLDREQEQRAVGQALARGQVVDVHGPDGMGKTALVSQAMYSQLPSAFPDGMVYLSARHETAEDLLQELLESFFETGEGHVKVTENDVRRSMAGKRALIAVDDANHLEEGEAEALAQVVPQCALLIAGREQQLWQGVGVPLGGLPKEEAVALFERHWGSVPAQERPTVGAICEALGDVPLAIIKTASTAAKRNVPLSQVLHEVQPRIEPRNPIGQTVGMIGGLLSEGEQRVLAGLAAPGGASVGLDALEAITGLPLETINRYLARLEKMELVHPEDHRYSLDNGIRPTIRQVGVDEEMERRAAEYYRQRAGELRGQSPDPDEENVIAALGYCYQRQQWKQVIEIVRAMEPYLATTGRWGQWRKRLHNAWQAARELGDRASEAWAQNQLGVIALGLADAAAAASFFKGSLSIWQALGDRAGMAIARWNLQVLLGLPPPPPQKGKPPARPAGGGSSLPIILGVTAAVLTVVLTILIVVAIWPHPPPPPPPPPTQVELWLAAGCDETYEPGSTMVIQIRSNVAGSVDVYQVNPRGDRAFLFRQETEADQASSRDWSVPDGDGYWALEADLDGGQARARCGFEVKRLTIPRIQIWLEEGCGRTLLAGEASRVFLQANVDGQVDVYLADATGRRTFLSSQQVTASRLASQDWRVPDEAGNWTLEADLHDGQASARCGFTVELPQIQIQLEDGCNQSYASCQVHAIRIQSNVDGAVDVYLVNTEGESEFLFREQVTANQEVSREWESAKMAGDWTLEAELNGGQASGRCSFRVDPGSVRPVIGDIWIEPMAPDVGPTAAPGPICPWDKMWVYAQVSDPCGQELARVEIRARYPAGSGDWLPSAMFPLDAGTYRHPLTAHEAPGTEFYIYAEDGYGNAAQSDVQVYAVEPCLTPEGYP
jgi:hypothetical protein